MRCREDSEFGEWLLKVGDGQINDFNEQIRIPGNLIVQENIESTIYGDGHLDISDSELGDKVILVSKNKHVHDINTKVVNKINTEEKVYKGIDSIIAGDPGII